MSNTGKHPKVKMLQEANKVLSKLKAKTCGITFPNLGNPKKIKILAYSDATYASMEHGSFQGGIVLFCFSR